MKTIIARASFVHNSPRKLRLVADSVRGLGLVESINRLKLLPHRASEPLMKVFMQALGNAKNHGDVSPANLKVASLQIEEGPRVAKKADVHAHGARFDRGIRRKRLSHIKVILEETETNGTKN